MIENLVEVKLKNDDSFLVIKETLTRIGIASIKTKTLFQSCHILHKRGKFYIVHFKELFLLDGKVNTKLDEQDTARRNTIALLLEEWGLLEILNKSQVESVKVPISSVKIIPFKDKDNWVLQPKYAIGVKK